MKLTFALALSTFGLATATQKIDSASDSISASSRVGRSLLSRARRLDGNNDFSWVTNYSIKFEKCATSHDYYGGYFGGQGNNNNNNNNRNGYNGMYEQRLVHFKLCPSDSCASSCENGADYVVDMNEFVNAYMESKMDAQEYNCERVRENCYCDDANDDQACEYQCYLNAGLDYCDMGDNNNQNQNGQQQFDVQEALECRRLEVDEDAMNYYAYQNGMGNQYNNNNQRMEFFVGPYCSSNGKNIFLGVFMDETCSYEAPDGIYSKLNYGAELPYSKKSLIENNCVSCKEPQEYDENNNGDQQDADQVLEVCERLYEEAGKCESDIEVSNANGGYFYPNTMACEFIKGLKANGKTRLAMPHVSVTPKVLAGVFAATTAILAGVSYHLHKKVQRGNVQLADQGGQMS